MIEFFFVKQKGMGKTLQSIALVWVLLNQGPYGAPLLTVNEKVIIITPTTLVVNWKKEFIKWLSSSVRMKRERKRKKLKEEKHDLIFVFG